MVGGVLFVIQRIYFFCGLFFIERTIASWGENNYFADFDGGLCCMRCRLFPGSCRGFAF